MMEFEPIVSPIFVWIFGVVILVLIGILVFRIQKGNFSPRRKVLKQLLNSLFLLALFFLIVNPVWEIARNSDPVLIISEDLGKAALDFWKDSLGVRKVISISDYNPNSDFVILLGKDFPKEFRYALRAKSVNWIIPNSDQELAFLDFKGILRQGERQEIQGRMPLKTGSQLSISQAGNELETLVLERDQDTFQLDLTVSVLGRNEWEIRLDKQLVGTLRFFVQPAERLSYQLQFGFPNQETSTLSRYLIGKGAQVQEEIQLSKNTELFTKKQPLDSIDAFIIDPSQIQDSKLKKQLEQGASFLLINVNDPEAELKYLNKAFGTDFGVSAKAGVEFQVLENGLEALPFQWKASGNQRLLVEDAVAIQQIGNSKIGVSLLKTSFPLAQSGDSVGYDKIWNQILGELQPESKANWKVSAPVFENQIFPIEFNGEDSLLFLDLGSEQYAWSQSLINPNSKQIEWLANESGWQQINPELEFYVNESADFPMVLAQQERANFLRSKVWLSTSPRISDTKKPIPYWVWGFIFIAILTALWLEPKAFR
jgi:hypothetical protein